MRRILDKLSRHKFATAYVLLTFGMILGLYAIQSEADKTNDQRRQETADVLYDAALASCERGNTIQEKRTYI